MGGMEDDGKKRGGSGAMTFAVVALLIALPVLYVLSVGPYIWFHKCCGITCSASTFESYYWPIIWARQWEPVQWWFNWYQNLI